MGANFGENHPQLTQAIRGGLQGTAQGLQQMGNPNPQFRFSPPQQQNALLMKPKKKPLDTGINGNSNPFPSGPDTGLYG